MKWTTAVIALALAVLMAVPAAAAEPVCGSVFGIARLQASGAGTAIGSAVVFFDGSVQRVEIESQVAGPDVLQTWHFSQGSVDVVEHPSPGPLPGSRQSIDSIVDVQSPNSGTWQYTGVFSENTLRARFTVSGDLCISA